GGAGGGERLGRLVLEAARDLVAAAAPPPDHRAFVAAVGRAAGRAVDRRRVGGVLGPRDRAGLRDADVLDARHPGHRREAADLHGAASAGGASIGRSLWTRGRGAPLSVWQGFPGHAPQVSQRRYSSSAILGGSALPSRFLCGARMPWTFRHG